MPIPRFTPHVRILSTLLSRPPRRNSGPWALASLTALCFGAFLHWRTNIEMAASGRAVFEKGETWRLFTTLFAHSDTAHLLSNGAMYFILSYLLFGYFGPKIYPLLAWALAVPMTATALLTYAPDVNLVGASGLVHLMGGLWLSLYFFLSRNLRLTQRILRAGGVTLALFFPSSFEANVSYRVHFIGLAFGITAGTIYFLLNREHLRAFEEIDLEEATESSLTHLEEASPPQDDDDDEWPPTNSRDPRYLGPNRGHA